MILSVQQEDCQSLKQGRADHRSKKTSLKKLGRIYCFKSMWITKLIIFSFYTKKNLEIVYTFTAYESTNTFTNVSYHV